MHNTKLRRIGLLAVLLSLLFTCGAGQILSQTNPPLSDRNFRVGVGAIPRNFPNPSQQDILDMFVQAKTSGELLIWQTEWRDSLQTSGQIPQYIQLIGGQKTNYGYEPVLGINFHRFNGDSSVDFYSQTEKEQYKQVALAIVKEYKPKYLILGVEVNNYYLFHPAEFSQFVALYKVIYDEVKLMAPDTKVFVTFQLEIMKGLANKVWPQNTTTQWLLIDMFEGKLDLIAFTTYPQLIFNSPGQIPVDYYAEIAKYTNKPVAFTELAWSSGIETGIFPVNSTEQNQADFITKFLELTKDLNKEFIIWTFLHDVQKAGDAASPWIHLGLKNNNGSPKLSWSVWNNLASCPLIRLESLPQTAEILFVSDRDTGTRRTEIYSMDSKGGNITRLTYSRAHHSIMGIDRSLRYIVTSRIVQDTNPPTGLGDEDRKSLWVLDLAAKKEKLLTDLNDNAEGKSFDPNSGELIVFSMQRAQDNQRDIYATRRDGTGLLNLTNTLYAQEGDVAFSRDGTKIVFTYMDSSLPLRFRLQEMQLIAGPYGYPPAGTKRFIDTYPPPAVDTPAFPRGDYDPQYSLDNQWVVFERAVAYNPAAPQNFGQGVYHIFKVNPITTEMADLSAAGSHADRGEFLPSYAPDGRSIIFSSIYEAIDTTQSHVDIFTMDTNGGNLKRLTSHPGGDLYPVWFRNPPFLKTIGDTGFAQNQPNVIRQTTDGAFIMVWWRGISGENASIVKFNTVGDVQWAKSFTGPGYNVDLFKDIRQTSDGEYIAIGDTSSFGGPFDILLVKLLNNGDIQGVKTIGDGSTSGRRYMAESVQETPDGNYLIGGNTMTTSEISWNAFIAKVDKNGSLLGMKAFPGIRITGRDIVQQTPDGGFIIAGSQSHGDSDFIIVKLDIGGNIQWAKRVGGVYSDTAYSLQQNSDGSYTIIGNTSSFGAYKLLIVHLDSLGNIRWAKTLGDTTYQMGGAGVLSSQKTSDNGYIVTGTTDVAYVGRSLSFSKLDSSGNLQWTKLVKMPNSLNNYGEFGQQTFDGGYIITGIAQDISGATKTILLKADSDGNAGECGIIQSISPAVTPRSLSSTNHYLVSVALMPPVRAQSLTLINSTIPPSDTQCQK